MTARHEILDEYPRMERAALEAADERRDLMARAREAHSDPARRRYIARAVRSHQGADQTVRGLLAITQKATGNLRDEYEGAEDREFATAQALANKKGGRKTRRRNRRRHG